MNMVVVVVGGLVILGIETLSTTLIVVTIENESLEDSVEVTLSTNDFVSMGSPDREVSISEASPKRRIPTVLRCSFVLEQEMRRRKISGNTNNAVNCRVSEPI